MSSQGQKTLETRRRQEDIARAMQASLTDHARCLAKADFENSTTRKLEQRTKNERFQSIQHKAELNLLSRRQQLADLYNYERHAWQQECLQNVETVEERKNRIMERAYKLRDDREAKRMEYVRKCYDEQWRDACDEARTLDSQAMLQWVKEERLKRINDNIQGYEMTDEEKRIEKEFQINNEKLDKAEQDKKDYMINSSKYTQEELRRQIESNHQRRLQNMEREQREADEEIMEVKEALAKEAALERKLKEDAHARGKATQEYNAQFLGVRQDEEDLEKRQDKQLLAYALRKEREQIAAEDAKKEGQKQAALQYRKYLEELMVKEAEDNTELDAVRAAEEMKIWKARDKVLQDREDARKYLMQQVDQGRQEQIKIRREREAKAIEDEKVYSKKFLQDAKEGVARENAEAEHRRRIAEDNNVHLMSQIELRRQRSALEKQEEYLANKHMERIERLTKERLEKQAGKVRTNFPVSSIKWYS